VKRFGNQRKKKPWERNKKRPETATNEYCQSPGEKKLEGLSTITTGLKKSSGGSRCSLIGGVDGKNKEKSRNYGQAYRKCLPGACDTVESGDDHLGAKNTIKTPGPRKGSHIPPLHELLATTRCYEIKLTRTAYGGRT